MAGNNGGGETAQRKEGSWTYIGGGDIHSEGHTELMPPVLLGVLECVLKGERRNPNFRN